MAVMKKRTRLVSFRLSEQEYEALQSYSMTEGARSISDFARTALGHFLEGNRGRYASSDSSQHRHAPGREASSVMVEGFEMLIATMAELNRVIARLSSLIESSNHTNADRL
jgi:hypothetical protein